MKKVISIICAAAALASAWTINASAKDEYTAPDGNTYEYHINSYGVSIDKVIPAEGADALVIPAEIDGTGVYLVSRYAFKDCADKIKSITVPGDVGTMNFGGLPKLENVTLGDGVEEIDDMCFNGCSALASINIPDSVTRLGDMCFTDCISLKSITIPDSVKKIGQEAFHGCSALTEINWNEKAELNINVFAGTPYLRDGRDGYILTDNGKTFYSWGGKDTVVEIPEGVTKISDGAFMESDITKVICPKSMTKISDNAFLQADKLQEVEFRGAVTELGMSAFADISSLEKLEIPDTVTDIKYGCFNLCTGLKSIDIPDSVTNIEPFAFSSCRSAEAIKLSGRCKVIPEYCFQDCRSVKEIVIPECVERIDNEAFARCAELEEVSIGADVKLGENVFVSTPYRKSKKQAATPAPTQNAAEGTPQPTDTQEPAVTAEPGNIAEPPATEAPSEQPDEIAVKSGDRITVEVNDKPIVFRDAEPFIDENGRTQIPIRAIAEALGCEVDWDEAAQTAVITKGDTVIKIVIDKNTMQVGNETVTMDTAAQIVGDRTYIPVRFVGEAMGMAVNWSE